MKKNEYSLFTTIAMIVGIVIGSGIFFKSDNILIATNGNILLGILIFCIASISIIFGSLTIAELASRTDETGGIIAYAEKYCNKNIACALGWFHTFLYYPTLIAVVAWVAGIYICLLFNIESTILTEIFIGEIVVIVLFLVNILSAKLGGYVQNASTVIKLLPLIFIAVAGLFLGKPSSIEFNDITNMTSLGWIAAITPIAFSFDGWIVATSISHEIKNPKKNLPRALIFAPLFILAIYIAYFVGISTYVGAEKVMSLGDSHVAYAATNLLGEFGAKIILILVIISIIGTINGLILGLIRLPNALAERDLFPYSKKFKNINKNYGISIVSAITAFFICFFWIIIHYFTQKLNLLPNSDISEISITFNYIGYMILYYQVLKMGLKGEISGLWKGKLNPIFASIGSITILLGSLNNKLFFIYAFICFLVIALSILFMKKNKINV